MAIVTFAFAMAGRHQLYWISALGTYIFSFIAGFSIGQLTVGLAFIPLTLAIGHYFEWIKNRMHGFIFLFLGIVIGVLMTVYVGNVLFYPLFPLFDL